MDSPVFQQMPRTRPAEGEVAGRSKGVRGKLKLNSESNHHGGEVASGYR